MPQKLCCYYCRCPECSSAMLEKDLGTSVVLECSSCGFRETL